MTPSLVVVLLWAAAAMGCGSPCRPWVWAEPGGSPLPCNRGDNMDFRVMLGHMEGSVNSCHDQKAGIKEHGYKSYFFCPKVDSFTAVSLGGSARLLNSTRNCTMELAVYGTGISSSVRVPEHNQESRVVAYEHSHPKCPDGGAAIASFLIYNITLKDGDFAYKNRDPIGNGFVSTCDDEGKSCHFDNKGICIGSAKKFNCAACVSGFTDIDKANIRVLMSFYGTGSNGKPMLSGSSNPMNFRQFAVGNMYSDIREDVSSIDWPSI